MHTLPADKDVSTMREGEGRRVRWSSGRDGQGEHATCVTRRSKRLSVAGNVTLYPLIGAEQGERVVQGDVEPLEFSGVPLLRMK